jgi:predicted ArsR family transcriptional regulator
MRALAHPFRLTLLELLQREGSLTSTRASHLTGESTGACSFHLRQLAKYGFVEPAEGGHGRERPWKRSYQSHRWKPSQAEPEMSAAVAALNSVVLQRHFDSASAFLRAGDAEPAEWRDAALFSDSLQYLTAGELAQLRDDLLALARRRSERGPALRPSGARPVYVIAFAFPLPPTPTGN